MICQRCNSSTSRLIYRGSTMACASCWGLSEAGGPKIDGTLTRNSFRIREQQRQYEADIITPHIYDSVSKKVVPNPDFIKQHTDKVANFFDQKELEGAGYQKIAPVFEQIASEKAAVRAETLDVTGAP